MRVCLLTCRVPPTRCGVGDYTFRLGETLRSLGHDVTVLTGANQTAGPHPDPVPTRRIIPGWRVRDISMLIKEIETLCPDRLLIQWVPFLYGHTGINFALPLAALILSKKGIAIHTVVHELWVGFDHWSRFFTGPFQRICMLLLALASRTVCVSSERGTQLLKRYFPFTPEKIRWVSVGSNIPLSPAPERSKWLADAAIHPEDKILSIFSPFGTGKLVRLLEETWFELSSKCPHLTLVAIGAAKEQARRISPTLSSDPRVVFTGYLPESSVSQWLQVSDVFLVPYDDGISGRRGSAMAAMAHGVPTVTTRGINYEADLFDDSPLVIVGQDKLALANAITCLLQSPNTLKKRGEETRRFYLNHFDWKQITEQVLSPA